MEKPWGVSKLDFFRSRLKPLTITQTAKSVEAWRQGGREHRTTHEGFTSGWLAVSYAPDTLKTGGGYPSLWLPLTSEANSPLLHRSAAFTRSIGHDDERSTRVKNYCINKLKDPLPKRMIFFDFSSLASVINPINRSVRKTVTLINESVE